MWLWLNLSYLSEKSVGFHLQKIRLKLHHRPEKARKEKTTWNPNYLRRVNLARWRTTSWTEQTWVKEHKLCWRRSRPPVCRRDRDPACIRTWTSSSRLAQMWSCWRPRQRCLPGSTSWALCPSSCGTSSLSSGLLRRKSPSLVRVTCGPGHRWLPWKYLVSRRLGKPRCPWFPPQLRCPLCFEKPTGGSRARRFRPTRARSAISPSSDCDT